MNIAALIDLVKEVLNKKDDSTKRIAAGLTLLYIVAQYQPIQDALLAFAHAHQAGLEGAALGIVIAALFKSPNKSKLSSSPATPELQEEKADAAQAGKP